MNARIEEENEALEMERTAPPAPAPARGGSGRYWLGAVLRAFLFVAILAGSGAVAYHWMTNQPKTQRVPPKREAALVEVLQVTHGLEPVVVDVWGTVVPAQTIQLAARVSGQVVEVSPELVPGGRFRAGDVVLQIERRDYELAVEESRAALARADAALKLELGQQSVAQREFELLGEVATGQETDLVLRQPQLKSAEAALAAARAALEQAELDLARTTVTAPFNAVVQQRNVDLGSHITPGMSLATLAGTDQYWVEVSLGVDDLRWIDVPGPENGEGSGARVYHEAAWGPDVFREGRVVRLLTSVEPGGRMARLHVAVADPLDLTAAPDAAHPLLLESFVRVQIKGRELPQVVRVPRTAVRDGANVWVMNSENVLEVRPIEVAWSGEEDVFVSQGLADGERLVVSDLATAVPGLPLRTADKGAPEAASAASTPQKGKGKQR